MRGPIFQSDPVAGLYHLGTQLVQIVALLVGDMPVLALDSFECLAPILAALATILETLQLQRIAVVC